MNEVHGIPIYIWNSYLEFVFVYDVIKVHLVSGSPDYDVVMTE